jgi:glycosyltransferase involved in cell wall biosynthesis
MPKRSDSSAKAKALFLSPEFPYPVRGGGPLRSASLLEYLARRFAVHAIVFRQPGDPDPAQVIPPGLIEKMDVLELPYHSKHPIARTLRNSRRLIRNVPPLVDRFAGFEKQIATLAAEDDFSFAVVEHFWCAPYVDQLRRSCRQVILDLHNIESAWHQSVAQSEGAARAGVLRRFAAESSVLERRWLPKYDALLVTSPADAVLVRGMVPGANPIVYPNALPEIALPPRLDRQGIAFSGNLEYQPNVSAVRFFYEKIWPGLRARPGLIWKIIGKNPEGIRRIVAGDPRIVVTGFVDDAVQELAAVQMAIVPLLAGSGTRVKILEAWAAGTPVVSTTLGAQGLDCQDQEHLLLADSPEKFAAAVAQLLDSSDDRRRIAAAGRKLYEARYTWPKVWKSLDPLFGNAPESEVV